MVIFHSYVSLPEGSIHIGYIAVGAAQKHISTFGFGKHVSHAQVTFGLVDPNRWTLGKMIPRMHGILSQDSRLGSGTLQPENTEHVANGRTCHIGDFRKYVIDCYPHFCWFSQGPCPFRGLDLHLNSVFSFFYAHSSSPLV